MKQRRVSEAEAQRISWEIALSTGVQGAKDAIVRSILRVTNR